MRVLAILALTVPSEHLPRDRVVALGVGGLAALALWALLSRSWAPLAGPAGDEAQRDALYLGALAAGVLALRSSAWARVVEPAVILGGVAMITVTQQSAARVAGDQRVDAQLAQTRTM